MGAGIPPQLIPVIAVIATLVWAGPPIAHATKKAARKVGHAIEFVVTFGHKGRAEPPKQDPSEAAK